MRVCGTELLPSWCRGPQSLGTAERAVASWGLPPGQGAAVALWPVVMWLCPVWPQGLWHPSWLSAVLQTIVSWGWLVLLRGQSPCWVTLARCGLKLEFCSLPGQGMRMPQARAARMAALDVLLGRKLVLVLVFLLGWQPLLRSPPTCGGVPWDGSKSVAALSPGFHPALPIPG